MNKYFSILNTRTLLALGISMVVSFVTLEFNFQYNYDLALISIAIIFPLVFTIRSAFRRREKALEYLSRFKAGLITVRDSFLEIKKLDSSRKDEVKGIMKEISISLIQYLGARTVTKENVQEKISRVFAFIQTNDEHIGTGTALKIFRFMKEVHYSSENIIAVNQHRTPIAMRAYCLIFIYIYPFIYTPALYHKLHDGISLDESWIVYFLSAISTFILISLYNVQDQMENPFDQKGLDDIRLDDFLIK
jgi:ABC-type multidrug transport system fused ATPase/permease subunit